MFMRALLLFSCLSLSLPVLSSDGAAIYTGQCVVCHGAKGEGSLALSGPALAGQSEAYIARQLNNFKSGLRGKAEGDALGMQMAAISAGLSDQDQVAVSQYLAQLPMVSVKSDAAAADLKQGEKLYQSYCGSCHGSDASGNDALNSPNLRLLSAPFLAAQYAKFLNGQRGYEKADKFGRQMSMMARAMAEPADLEAVIAYIHSLNP
mgnify:CR=1 FL=1